jgi:general transcription factor 3C polypeptide 3 (transcription factor C subunit 4)
LPVLRARAHHTKDRADRLGRPRADYDPETRLTKRTLEEQMAEQMHSLWADVQEAEVGIDNGDLGALEQFIYAAGTMIENYRLARGNFNKSRVNISVKV